MRKKKFSFALPYFVNQNLPICLKHLPKLEFFKVKCYENLF